MKPITRTRGTFLVILTFAAILRLTGLGRESFWLDEAGVAIAASQKILSDAINIARGHAAAMPLDYIVAWLMGRLSLSEIWLRMPEALWGIAGVWAVFFAARKIIEEKISLLIAFLVAIAPIHVYLSQELRFYSGLFFFYWLTTGLLFQSLENPRWRNWIVTIIVGVIGSYFHIYTVLAFANGFFYLILRFPLDKSFRDRLFRFILSGVILGLMVLPGLLYFVVESKMGYALGWDIALSQVLIALGLFPIYATRIGFITAFASWVIVLAGFWIAFRQNNRPVIALFVSVVIQIGLIFAADILNGYFISWRQMYFLLPISLISIGVAIQNLYNRTQSLVKSAQTNTNYQKGNQFFAILLVIGLSALTLLNSIENRQFTKSNAREIITQIEESWQPGETILITPWYDTQLYQYYFGSYPNSAIITAAMKGINLPSISTQPNESGHIYLSTHPLTSQSDFTLLESMGFHLENDPALPLWLWVRKN